MNHDEYREKLSALLDEELDEREKAEVLAHLNVCEACRTYLIELTAVHDALNRMDTPSVPEGFAAGVMARLPENESKKSIKSVDNAKNAPKLTPRSRSRRMIASVAAAAAVLAIVSVPRMFRMGGAAPESASSLQNGALYGASGSTYDTAAAEAFPAESAEEEAPLMAAGSAPMMAMEAPAEMAEEFNTTSVGDALDGGSVMESKSTVTTALPEARALMEADEELAVLTLTGDGAAEWLAEHGEALGDGRWLVSVEDVNALPDTLELIAEDDVQRPTDGMLVITLAEGEATP